MTSSIDKLRTDPWLIAMTPTEARAYRSMRLAESDWLLGCVEGGCALLRRSDDESSRQVLVLVPPGATVPAINTVTYEVWREVAASAAQQQNKHMTIGSRSSREPEWVRLDSVLATKVTQRTASAARGAIITEDDAIELLRRRAYRAKEVHDNSLMAGQKSRAMGQADALAQADADLAIGIQVIDDARAAGATRISAQVQSGEAWLLRVTWADLSSRTVTVPTVSMLRVAAGLVVTDAHTRARHTPEHQQVVQVGPVKLTIYYPH